MSDYYYTIVYGSEANKYGRIRNPQHETVQYADVLNYIKNIQFPYVDLVKSILPISNNQYKKIHRKLKTIYMHYKPNCPFTRDSIDVIIKTPVEIVFRLWNIETNGKATRSIVEKYLQSRGISHVTFPQFFFRGEPLGGADNLGISLTNVLNID